jgi:hypothetical protein
MDTSSFPAGSGLAPGAAVSDDFDRVEPLRPLLQSLCERMQVPAESWRDVLDSGSPPLGRTVVSLESEAISGFVKVYVHLGRPVEEDALSLYRFLLSRMILQPAPFLFTAGIHPQTEHVFLCAALPWSGDGADDEEFVGLLEACVQVHDALHAELPAGVGWA